MVAVPLAMVAASLAALFWLWLPLALLAWWWAPRDWPWTWLLAVQAGALGAMWAFAGADLLAIYPDQRPLVELLWTGFAVLLVILFTISRRRGLRS
jgi:hypothetical protein